MHRPCFDYSAALNLSLRYEIEKFISVVANNVSKIRSFFVFIIVRICFRFGMYSVHDTMWHIRRNSRSSNASHFFESRPLLHIEGQRKRNTSAYGVYVLTTHFCGDDIFSFFWKWLSVVYILVFTSVLGFKSPIPSVLKCLNLWTCSYGVVTNFIWSYYSIMHMGQDPSLQCRRLWAKPKVANESGPMDWESDSASVTNKTARQYRNVYFSMQKTEEGNNVTIS